MDAKTTFRPYLVPTLILLGLGWGGLALLVLLALPTVWVRWGFFALFTLGWIGAALPAAYFLNLRFPSTPPAQPNVILRQSTWAGVYWSTLAWLQLGDILTLWVAVGLAAGLCAVEYLIRMRESSQWRPPAPEPPAPDGDANVPNG
ncbi:MAG: hypothetical protein FJZ96_05080 [Chloroflexi bacterium]|nr:hypothetical protein [Chloroflexota bacterium]